MSESDDPNEFQTVEWWIEQLKEFPPSAPVRVASESSKMEQSFQMLSAYMVGKYLYIDVGT